MLKIDLNRSQYLELEKLSLGAFQPVTGFMNEREFHSVVNDMRLPSGEPYPLPIILDVSAETAAAARNNPEIDLHHEGVHVGTLQVEDIFQCEKLGAAQKIFGTDSIDHPGVRFFLDGSDYFLGGPITMTSRVEAEISRFELTPEEAKKIFQDRGWNSIAGFQTRNVPHRAHEYLQRVALERADGLFIQPLVGRKKSGDYTPEAVIRGYEALVDGFYPNDRVVLGVLTTSMRYAGPREAVFHAIIRRNYGCTQFIVGRDHAGVGSYYEKYAAHELAKRFEDELGIEILALNGPYYCARCDGIVTERTCPHETTEPDAVMHISGTDIRAMLSDGMDPDPRIIRRSIIDSLHDVPLFIEDDSA